MNRIFTLSPGRSGTHWLSAFFCIMTRLGRTAPDPDIFPYPKNLTAIERKKIVERLWKELPDPYVNTSLVAKLGYFEFLEELGARFIYLRRSIKDNAYSWHRMNGTPGRTPRGNWYHPEPSSPLNLIDVTGFHEELTDYQLCAWLCMEVEARADKLAETADVYTVDIEKISKSKELARDLLKWTRIPCDVNWFVLLENQKVHASNKPPPEDLLIDDVEQVDQIEELHERLKA